MESSLKKINWSLDKVLELVAIIIGFLSILSFIVPIFSIETEEAAISVFGFSLTIYPSGYAFAPIVFITFLLPLIGAILAIFKNRIKDIELVTMVLYLLSAVLYFTLNNYASIGTGLEQSFSLAPFTYIYASFLAVATLIEFYLLNSQNRYSVYDLVEAAILIAMAIVLDLDGLKISVGADGGSISFTTIPLAILALRQGPYKSFIGIGVVYGLITCLLDGWGLQTYPFDYLLAYGSFATIGFFKGLIFPKDKNKFNIRVLVLVGASVLAVMLRYLFATLSSMILYETTFVAGLAYNATYVLPSGAVMIAALVALYHPLIKLEVYQRSKNAAK